MSFTNGFRSIPISDFVQDPLQDKNAAHLHSRIKVAGNQTSQGIRTAHRGRAAGVERASTRVHEYVMSLFFFFIRISGYICPCLILIRIQGREIPEEVAARTDSQNEFPAEMWRKLGDAGLVLQDIFVPYKS